MAVCCCSLAGTAACQHCSQNPFATDVWTNKTVTVDHVEAKPFGNGIDVCPVCGKPYTNYDRIKRLDADALAEEIVKCVDADFFRINVLGTKPHTKEEWSEWLKRPIKEEE